MHTPVLIIFMIVFLTSPFGLSHLAVNYGYNWKFKDLRPFGKFVFFYLLGVIALWFGLITYLIVTSIK